MTFRRTLAACLAGLVFLSLSLLARGGTADIGPEATVREYFGAFAGRDGPTACAQFAPEVRRLEFRSFRAKRDGVSCPQAMMSAARATGNEAIRALRDLQILETDVRDDRAKVEVNVPGGDVRTDLVKLRGRWYVFDVYLVDRSRIFVIPQEQVAPSGDFGV